MVNLTLFTATEILQNLYGIEDKNRVCPEFCWGYFSVW